MASLAKIYWHRYPTVLREAGGMLTLTPRWKGEALRVDLDKS